jgi:hypothetical protein
MNGKRCGKKTVRTGGTRSGMKNREERSRGMETLIAEHQPTSDQQNLEGHLHFPLRVFCSLSRDKGSKAKPKPREGEQLFIFFFVHSRCPCVEKYDGKDVQIGGCR